jgi:hypothetical protein
LREGRVAVDLPKGIIEAIGEGRAVLFLGAGASRGATDEKGIGVVDGKGLAALIVDQFLGRDYEGYDFRGAYDLAGSSRDILTVQKFLFDYFIRFHPAPFHLIIPTMPWAGLLTTNYDLVIERAYNKAKELQHLVPHVKDDDGALDRLDYKSLLYIKLHGCITRHHEVHPPLVASTDQLIAFRDGRQGQFDTFLEWAKTKTLIFVGYAFMDSNLRLLFDEIIREGDKPRIFCERRCNSFQTTQLCWGRRASYQMSCRKLLEPSRPLKELSKIIQRVHCLLADCREYKGQRLILRLR